MTERMFEAEKNYVNRFFNLLSRFIEILSRSLFLRLSLYHRKKVKM